MLAFMAVAAAIAIVVFVITRLWGIYQAGIEEARLQKWDQDQERRMEQEREKILHPKQNRK